jgi:hypothetical protein
MYEDGVKRQYTAAEETARDADEIKCNADLNAIKTLTTAKTTKKASAVAKLKALGLTDAEIGALKI